jgi:UDP-N-acetylmuramate dehydrogenase
MEVIKDFELARLTSFGVGGKAENFVEIVSGDQLKQLFESTPEKLWLIGEGTNVLVSDEGLPGTTVKMKNSGIVRDGNKLTAQAGTDWDDLVMYAISNNLWGLELMSGIPGTVGAGVAGNIAAYGQSIAHTLEQIEVFDVATKTVKIMTCEELEFDYRTSFFNRPEVQNLIILSATFELSPNSTMDLQYHSAKSMATEHNLDHENLNHRREIILKARQKAGSLLGADALKTAGSFYKNPLVSPEVAEYVMSFDESGQSAHHILSQNKIHGGSEVRVSAAHVLLAAGFERGQTWGQVQLHPDHILKIVNMGEATANSIYSVHLTIVATVKEKLGITLENEVKFLGKF